MTLIIYYVKYIIFNNTIASSMPKAPCGPSHGMVVMPLTQSNSTYYGRELIVVFHKDPSRSKYFLENGCPF